jgi:hypothetical protein
VAGTPHRDPVIYGGFSLVSLSLASVAPLDILHYDLLIRNYAALSAKKVAIGNMNGGVGIDTKGRNLLGKDWVNWVTSGISALYVCSAKRTVEILKCVGGRVAPGRYVRIAGGIERNLQARHLKQWMI